MEPFFILFIIGFASLGLTAGQPQLLPARP